MSEIIFNGPVKTSGLSFFGDNHGNITTNAESQSVVQYHTQQIGNAPSPWDINPFALRALLLSTLGALANVLDILASILSWLNMAPSSIDHIEAFAWALVIGFSSIAMMSLNTSYIVSKNRWYRLFGRLYVRKDDNSVDVYQITAKCPVDGCPGTLHLKRPAPNEEGVGIAGICDKWGERHMFEFNDETYRGSRIERLTPNQQSK